MSGRWSIAATVVRSTQMRAAFQHLARDFYIGQTRVIAGRLKAPTRVSGYAASFPGVHLMPGSKPVRCPLPDVSDHVVDAISVRREGSYRRSAGISVEMMIGRRKRSLPSVGHMTTARGKFRSPSIFSLFEPPRAANSHSASVGRSFPFHRA